VLEAWHCRKHPKCPAICRRLEYLSLKNLAVCCESAIPPLVKFASRGKAASRKYCTVRQRHGINMHPRRAEISHIWIEVEALDRRVLHKWRSDVVFSSMIVTRLVASSRRASSSLEPPARIMKHWSCAGGQQFTSASVALVC
jgi:hypothetical protein